MCLITELKNVFFYFTFIDVIHVLNVINIKLSEYFFQLSGRDKIG